MTRARAPECNGGSSDVTMTSRTGARGGPGGRALYEWRVLDMRQCACANHEHWSMVAALRTVWAAIYWLCYGPFTLYATQL